MLLLLAAALGLPAPPPAAAKPRTAKSAPETAPETAPGATLEQTEAEMEETRAAQERLREENEKLEEEMSRLQSQLVKLAAQAQRSESDLSAAEERLRILTREMEAKDRQIKAQERHLAALVRASLSLSHTPPEAMVMMPGDVTRTMKAARALKMASAGVRAETRSLGLQLAELEGLKDKVARNRDALVTAQQAIDLQQQGLVQKLSERRELQKRLGSEARKTEERLRQLARQTRDLQQLVSEVEQQRETGTEEAAARRKSAAASFAAARGRIRTPVSGRLLRRFGSAEGRNATAKGITIETRAHASVTAPFDGEVVFTGPFLTYGQMVIIHHSDHYHTLLAGLQKIDVQVGQFLLEGEPIGAMGEDASGNRLYVELRKNNQPVDPAPWMSAFAKRAPKT